MFFFAASINWAGLVLQDFLYNMGRKVFALGWAGQENIKSDFLITLAKLNFFMNEIGSEIKTKKSFLEKLESLRDDWSNEIPEEEIHGYQNPGKYKVLKTWFTLVVSDLQFAVSQGEITDPKTIKKVNGFVKKFTSKDFHSQQRVTQEDIQRADKIINLALHPKGTASKFR